MKVLVEGIGSMVFGTQLKYYQEMGWELIGIDITNQSFGLYQKNIKPYLVPRYSEEGCFDEIEKIIAKEKIQWIFPTIHEGLLQWSRRKKEFKKKYNAEILLSEEKTIEICIDKWKTYQFFLEHQIPTAKTSLKKEYSLLKPRIGRGSAGIFDKSAVAQDFNMEGYISQEKLQGEEYTIDVLCDLKSNPIYIIPRIRLDVESGVSTKGRTVYDPQIIEYVKKIIKGLQPIGIINIQCFKNGEEISFIEINPRIAGGSSLSFASSDNWFKAMECFVLQKPYIPRQIVYNTYMFRYYKDVIVQQDQLIW